MTHEQYARIANNKNDPSLPEMKIRADQANILSQAMLLIKSENDPHYADAFRSLLSKAFYDWAPQYFFDRPASSSGKYHPAFANRENGLLLHSLAVARIADFLFEIVKEDFADLTESRGLSPGTVRNIVITAAFLHDMLKYGDPDSYRPDGMTVHEHPKLMAGFMNDPDVIRICEGMGLSRSCVIWISELINSHMGPWTTSKYSNVVLDAPATKLEKLLFSADYLASRKENEIVKDLI